LPLDQILCKTIFLDVSQCYDLKMISMWHNFKVPSLKQGGHLS
jgi:hypothetical protein